METEVGRQKDEKRTGEGGGGGGQGKGKGEGGNQGSGYKAWIGRWWAPVGAGIGRAHGWLGAVRKGKEG